MKHTEHHIYRKSNFEYHIIIKLINVQNKKKIMKEAREKCQVTNKRNTVRIIPDFSMGTLKTRMAWNGILQVLIVHVIQRLITVLSIHSPQTKLSIVIEKERKIFYYISKFMNL